MIDKNIDSKKVVKTIFAFIRPDHHNHYFEFMGNVD